MQRHTHVGVRTEQGDKDGIIVESNRRALEQVVVTLDHKRRKWGETERRYRVSNYKGKRDEADEWADRLSRIHANAADALHVDGPVPLKQVTRYDGVELGNYSILSVRVCISRECELAPNDPAEW